MSGIDRKFRVRGDLAGSREETLLELAAEETGESCIDHTTEPISMDKDQSHVTERLLDLTLEIIYVLTGEDCEIVKKLSREPLTPSKRLHETSPLTVPRPHCLTPESKAKKILEVTKKITELLTGEVPEKDEDITVSVKGYLKGHKGFSKDIMMASQPALTSPDGSSNGNPPERCSRLHARDSTQEDLTISHHCQGKELTDIKIKEEEEETTFLIVQQTIEEDGPLYTQDSTQEDLTIPHHHQVDHTTPHHRQVYSKGSKRKNIKVKVKKNKGEALVSGDQPSMEEEEMIMKRKKQASSLYISTSGDYVRNTSNVPGAKLIRKKKRSKNPSNLQGSAPDRSSEGTQRSTDPSNSLKDGLKLLPCSVCRKSFKNVYLKTHSKHKPYICLECANSYNLQKYVFRRQRILLGTGLYSCTVCNKNFTKRQSFVIHLRVHTGEKPYVCKECGNGFTQQSNLRRHQRSHAGIRRFMCAECKKCFTCKRNLLRHLQRSHACNGTQT